MDPVSAASAAARGIAPAAKAVRLVRHVPPVRRWLLTRGLRDLKPGDNLATFCRVLGEPRSQRRQATGRFLHVWPGKDVLARALTVDTDDHTVVAYRVERAAKGYRPRVDLTPGSGHPYEVRLGRSTFGQLPGEPLSVSAMLGANWWEYREVFYGARPGWYQHYGFDAGWLTFDDDLRRMLDLFRLDVPLDTPAWQAIRHKVAIEAYAVYDASYQDDWDALPGTKA